jgi:hypothetical protein
MAGVGTRRVSVPRQQSVNIDRRQPSTVRPRRCPGFWAGVRIRVFVGSVVLREVERRRTRLPLMAVDDGTHGAGTGAPAVVPACGRPGDRRVVEPSSSLVHIERDRVLPAVTTTAPVLPPKK